MKRLTPADIRDNDDFELLAEVSHSEIKQFIIEQVMNEREVVRIYGVYQVAMVALVIFILAKAVILFSRGFAEPLMFIGGSVLFSVTVLVVIHEFIHAVAYWLTGARNIKAGAIWRKFIFYIAADREVIDYPSFKIVALAPFVLVKVSCVILTVLFWSNPLAYFFLSLMCIHSLFCAGDMAMLAFYRLHHDKEIYNFDDLKEGKTFFFYRK